MRRDSPRPLSLERIHMRRKVLIATVLLLLGVAPTLSACSWFDTSITLDPKAVEVTVTQGIIDQTGVEPTVVCPKTMRGHVGDVLTCTATDKDGNTATVKVTVANDKGQVAWEVVQNTATPTPAP